MFTDGYMDVEGLHINAQETLTICNQNVYRGLRRMLDMFSTRIARVVA